VSQIRRYRRLFLFVLVHYEPLPLFFFRPLWDASLLVMVIGKWLNGKWLNGKWLPITSYQLPITNYQSPITSHQLPVTASKSLPCCGKASKVDIIVKQYGSNLPNRTMSCRGLKV
jgi:hypothetical protein